LDFSPNAAGATYRAENVPDGVPIDGQPDSFLQLVFPMWREVIFEEGRVVLLAQNRPTPVLVRTYYKDDAAPDEADTGDKMSYGDNGVVSNTVDGLGDVGFLGQMVALHPDSEVTAEDLAEQLANPIVIEIEVESASSTIYVPFVTKR
jgi:hypothetical protein